MKYCQSGKIWAVISVSKIVKDNLMLMNMTSSIFIKKENYEPMFLIIGNAGQHVQVKIADNYINDINPYKNKR